ncbi:MAG: DUF4198 domain-containing protein [Vicinamibacteria bacterium]
MALSRALVPALALFALPALAEDTWLAATARVEPRSLLRMELTSGAAFPDLERPVEAASLATSACRVGGKDVAMGVGPHWQYALRLRAWMAEPGIAVCRAALDATYAKAVVRVGDTDDDSWSEPVGLGLEIVPLGDPTRLHAGDTLAVRVLENGRPLAGLSLRTLTRGRAPSAVTTDARGEASIALGAGGPWLIAGAAPSARTTLTLDVAP